jgi:amino acid transporter
MATLPAVTWDQAVTAGLLLMFAFGGFDTLVVPAGESKNPRTDLPFALVWTMLISMLVMCSVQVVTMATLSGLAGSKTPVADSAAQFLGPVGAAMIGIGSVVSMLGNNAGSLLAGPRILFALAENGDLPQVFSTVHRKYRTPANAIWFSTAVTVALALSGSFVVLAEVSTIARLMTYAGVSLATLALRRPQFLGRVQPAAFVVPLGATVPVLALAVSLAILAGISRSQMLAGAAALSFGALLFFWNDAAERRRKIRVAAARAQGAS